MYCYADSLLANALLMLKSSSCPILNFTTKSLLFAIMMIFYWKRWRYYLINKMGRGAAVCNLGLLPHRTAYCRALSRHYLLLHSAACPEPPYLAVLSALHRFRALKSTWLVCIHRCSTAWATANILLVWQAGVAPATHGSCEHDLLLES